MSAPDCGILVPSWDGYADLWQPFFTLLFRYWPDCPFPVYLGANESPFEHDRVTVLRVPARQGWSAEVSQQLERVPHEYVLLVLEDFFWRAPTPTTAILQCLRALRDMDGHMMRLVPRPGPDRRVPGTELFGEVAVGAPYRASTQAAIWRRSTLRNLMIPTESAWEFELNASRRSDALGTGFFAAWKPLAPYGHHVVERGKWFRHEAARLRALDIGCDFRARETMTRFETARWQLKQLRTRVLYLLPGPVREQLKRAVRGAFRLVDPPG